MKEYESINKYSDLTSYGFNALTGEACAYSMRILFDMNKEGEDIMKVFLGLPDNTNFAENWNSKVGGKEAISSIMLARRTVVDLCEFILMQKGYSIIYTSKEDFNIVGSNIILEHYANHDGYGGRYNTAANTPNINGRNVHQFTGRTL